ncbi:hypothetical protein LHGZ1_0693 [Laribacter hongkongensis]|uniref:Uncharacterized protein n=1 Tax=Laribacter hongkongensis TaxID=168471 RepID=A0A248LGC4_9NEIS|nr:hypothetical protein LHGZ1_0693 [Laribacter hongkongensis]
MSLPFISGRSQPDMSTGRLVPGVGGARHPSRSHDRIPRGFYFQVIDLFE